MLTTITNTIHTENDTKMYRGTGDYINGSSDE